VIAQAWAQLRAKNPAAAEALMRPLLARDPDDHHAAEALAQALLEQSKPKEAIRYIEQIVRKRPKRAAYRILLGDARQALGDQDGAVAAWQAALKWEPDNAEAKRRLHLE
jgi:predicted Zn-dependent protease